ncbi:hypothetical protein PINS_up001157 [Pythium insidiosum]|nr:hypothetical protein PINS_up001157 [Pythium insidiosum]
MMKKISIIEQDLLAARETIAELKDENTNLTLEAESRPSIRDYRLCQRRIQQLERQLSETKLALEEANDIHELRRFMGTKEMIDRDRLNHRLHLNRLNTLPRETLLEVVKEVCRVLNLTDITLITPSIHKLCHVVAAVPRMEKFIRDVCGFVFYQLPENSYSDRSFELEQVIPTLQVWMSERKKLFELEKFKTAIISELCKRSIEPSVLQGDNKTSSDPNIPRAVRIVAELVELEKGVLHHREIYSQANEELERRPSVLINQIVRHFSHLFQVKSTDGVLPKINEVFLFVNEADNFLKVIRQLLDLAPTAGVQACLDAIRSKVEQDFSSSRENNGDVSNEGGKSVPDATQNYVVDQRHRIAVGGHDMLTGVREVREMTILIRSLKKELGAATMQEILPRTKRLMELLSLSIHASPLHDSDEDQP